MQCNAVVTGLKEGIGQNGGSWPEGVRPSVVVQHVDVAVILVVVGLVDTRNKHFTLTALGLL